MEQFITEHPYLFWGITGSLMTFLLLGLVISEGTCCGVAMEQHREHPNMKVCPKCKRVKIYGND